MKLLESSQIALVAGGWEREGLPYMYDEFGGSGDRDMFNFNDTFGFLESQSPEEGTGPRPASDPNRTTGQDIGLAITVAVVIASTAVVAVTCPPAAGAAMWAIATTGAAASQVASNIR